MKYTIFLINPFTDSFQDRIHQVHCCSYLTSDKGVHYSINEDSLEKSFNPHGATIDFSGLGFVPMHNIALIQCNEIEADKTSQVK